MSDDYIDNLSIIDVYQHSYSNLEELPEVYKAKTSTGNLVVVKSYSDDADGNCNRAMFENEIQVYKLIEAHRDEHKGSQHIVNFLGHHIQGTKESIVLEYFPGDFVNNYIKRHLHNYKAILQVIRQIALGVEFFESLNINHRDLHGFNIIIDEGGMVKIFDFGLCCFPKSQGRLCWSSKFYSPVHDDFKLGQDMSNFLWDIYSYIKPLECFNQLMLCYQTINKQEFQRIKKLLTEFGYDHENNFGCLETGDSDITNKYFKDNKRVISHQLQIDNQQMSGFDIGQLLDSLMMK